MKKGAPGKPLHAPFFQNRLVPRTRLELVQGHAPRDFKSLASTCSATQAFSLF
jgi:hypothetical protein